MRRQIVIGLTVSAMLAILTLVGVVNSRPQLQQSGGSGGSTNLAQVAGTAASVNNGAVDAGTLRVTVANNSTGVIGLATGSNVIGHVVADSGSTTAVTGTVAVSESGTWTVQPGNTANTTPWFVKQVPLHGCAGNTLQDLTIVDVATGAGTAVTSADTCVFYIWVNNKTASPVNITVQDKSGTPIVYSTTFALTGNSDRRLDFSGHKFLGGVQLIAGTASALNAITYGVQ